MTQAQEGLPVSEQGERVKPSSIAEVVETIVAPILAIRWR